MRVYPRGTLGLPLVPISLFEASSKRMWVIGRVGYVYSIDLGAEEWMTLANLHYQCETRDGRQWFIRLEQTIVSYDPASGEWLAYDAADIQLSRVFSLTPSSHGLLWATGRHQGFAALSVFDGKRWEMRSHPEFARWIEPRGVSETADGTMVFGAGGRVLSDVPGAGGILRYGVDGRTGRVDLTDHHAPPGYPYYATAFAETPDGALWVGSTLIYRVNPETSAPEPVRGLGGENTVSMRVDHEGALWVAKEHFGVCRRLDDDWEVFTEADGVASLLLSDLLVLPDGSLLASSAAGISRFDGKSWTARAYPEQFGMVKRLSSMKLASAGEIWLNYCDDELQSPLLLQGGGQRYGAVRHRPEATPPETRIIDCLNKVAQPGNTHVTWEGSDPWGATPREQLQYSWCLNGGEWSAYAADGGKTFLNLPHGPHVLEVRARDRDFNVDPSPDRAEFTVVAPLWLQPWFAAMVLLMVGSMVLLVWVWLYYHDKRLKDRARHLMEVDQVKTSFFTNISHELNTPLTLINGPLERVLGIETDGKKRKMLSMAARNAERVSTLVSQLLDFRRLETGQLQLEPVSGDIAVRIQEVMDTLRPLAQTRDVDLRFEGTGSCIGGYDADKLRKITKNLVDNAIKYTPSGGRVFVSLSVQDSSFVLSVEDSGVGIEPEHLERVFDRFYRVPEKSIIDGSGIGLNLTKDLVGLWGGTISVESPVSADTEHPGSRFTVALPFINRE